MNDAGSAPAMAEGRRRVAVALAGNPNTGKTTVFNALTGLRAKVGNYPGVTVERKEGRLRGTSGRTEVTVLDLPGAYSLSPRSQDERIARDALLGRLAGVPAPGVVVVVVDASNLQRHLYFATQVIELGYPTVVALNMMDVAEAHGHRIDAGQLARELGVEVVPLVASAGRGILQLRSSILRQIDQPAIGSWAPVLLDLPAPFREETERLAREMGLSAAGEPGRRDIQAFCLLMEGSEIDSAAPGEKGGARDAFAEARRRLEARGLDWRALPVESRYRRIGGICERVVTETSPPRETPSDRIDRWLTHRYWGIALLAVVLGVMFQALFVFAHWPTELLDGWVGGAGTWLTQRMPAGDLRSLLVDGVVAGVGAVVVFLPQICLLFLFIGLLEETGYMARAAFIMDRWMMKLGLHGRSFIPLLGSFACAIPGIMATRTIEGWREKLAVILVAPLMSCSARLPVYTLLIAACLPERRWLGAVSLSGLTLLGMYGLGVGAALFMAWLFRRTILRGDPPLLVMELPPYKRPALGMVLRHVGERAGMFLRQAGTLILAFNMVLWFLATYPRSEERAAHYAAARAQMQKERPGGDASGPDAPGWSDRWAALERQEAAERLEQSFAGRLGRCLEPVIAPLGMDWKIGIGIVSSFAARELFVSTMSTVYRVGAAAGSEPVRLAEHFRNQRQPDGSPVYTARRGLTLMVFYVFALQCASTVAVVRRETHSWGWPLFQWAYMGTLAWVFAWITWHGTRWLGLS